MGFDLADDVRHSQHSIKPESTHETRVSALRPAPLVAAEVDLRGMPYLPLDINRLRDSQLTIKASGDEFRAAVLLWCASWSQIPAASLPNDDDTLAAYAGYGRDRRTWESIRAGALRGFVLCSDGRLYHPVIAEKAVIAWEDRLDFNDRRSAEKDRKRRERDFRKQSFEALRKIGIVAQWDTSTKRLRELLAEHDLTIEPVTQPVTVTSHAPDTAIKGKGRERERERERESDIYSSSDTHTHAVEHAPEPTQAERACALMQRAGCKAVDAGHAGLVAALDAGVTLESLESTVREGAAKPGIENLFAWAVKTAHSRRTSSTVNPPAAPSPPREPSKPTRRLTDDQRAASMGKGLAMVRAMFGLGGGKE